MNKLQETKAELEEWMFDYWTCSNCGEIFDRNIDPPANEGLSLCIYCEDERYQIKMKGG